MQVRLDALPTQLARRLAPLYVVHGDEHLLAIEASDRIRAAARKAGYSERDVLQVDRHFKWNRLLESGQSMSLFGDRKLIELRIPGGKPGKEGSAALQAYAKSIVEGDTITLITLPRLDADQKKSAWFSALDAAGIAIDAPLVDRTRLPNWIAARLAAQGQSAGIEALAFIVDRVEGNLLAAHQEVQKLALLYPTGQIGYDDVREAVLDVARYDVFKLGEAMLAGDAVRVARMVDGLRGEGESPVLVHWAMTEEVRALFRAKLGVASGQPLSALLRQLRVWGGRERLFEPAMRRLSLPVLRSAMTRCAEIDRIVKGLRNLGTPMGDAWTELSRLGIVIAGHGAAKEAAR
ncbi:MAG: DNA polymerase III subunit delta [Burkholderiaceae bacterium]